MVQFGVSGAELRSLAGAVDGVADGAHAGARLRVPSPVGHAGLTRAVKAFTSKLDASWNTRVKATEKIASGLRKTASVYEKADHAATPKSGGTVTTGESAAPHAAHELVVPWIGSEPGHIPFFDGKTP